MKTLLTALVAMAIGVFTVPVMAAEFSVGDLFAAYSEGTMTDYIVLVIIEKIAENPTVSLVLLGLSASMPLIGFIANRTKNPIDNAVMIFLNKVLQTLAFNTSTNQPDVLSWSEMLSNKPKYWPAMVADKALMDGFDMRERVLSKRS